jgi:sulfur relay (sulfurtransferase) DsrC/TusE family protein
MSRSRKFTFEIKNYREDVITYLKELKPNGQCEYVAFYNENTDLKGFIRFSNQRTSDSLKKTLFKNNAITIEPVDPTINHRETMLLKPGFYETGKWTRLRKHEKPQPESQIDQINKMMAQHGDQMQKIMEICLALAKTNAVVTETAALVKNNHPPNQNIKQKFNLNIFLNEQCKNAMNLIDFVKSIKLQMEDLLLHSKVGYADAISAIFNKEINKLDLTMRPLHCTDAKREIIYVKNADKWQHDEANVIAEKAIETLTNRNYMQIKLWKEENPDYNSNPKKNLEYIKLVKNLVGGSSDYEQSMNTQKIIRNIIKNSRLDKEEAIVLMNEIYKSGKPA